MMTRTAQQQRITEIFYRIETHYQGASMEWLMDETCDEYEQTVGDKITKADIIAALAAVEGDTPGNFA